MTSIAPLRGEDKPTPLRIRDLYVRMLFTRIMDDYIWKLHTQGFIDFVASCRGHEAAQVGSALCIEVGKDFTLPYYRDLGVVLTIGMTPHEVFRTYLQDRSSKNVGLVSTTDRHVDESASFHHWGYHKHNTVTGPAPVATQLLHAAGIAFASKLRKASVVTIAYCGGSATTEPDFLEGLRFAAQHQLPVVFICEKALAQQPKGTAMPPSCLNTLPGGLTHQQVDGTDVVTVYQSMHAALRYAREGHGPILLEMHVVRALPNIHVPAFQEATGRRPFVFDGLRIGRENGDLSDPLVSCQHYLRAHGVWDDDWANQLCARISNEIECAWHDVLHDILQSSGQSSVYP